MLKYIKAESNLSKGIISWAILMFTTLTMSIRVTTEIIDNITSVSPDYLHLYVGNNRKPLIVGCRAVRYIYKKYVSQSSVKFSKWSVVNSAVSRYFSILWYYCSSFELSWGGACHIWTWYSMWNPCKYWKLGNTRTNLFGSVKSPQMRS